MANLLINFEAPSPDPINGYVVKYRKKGTVPYTTLSPNPKSSPITVPNVSDSEGYEGTIQCDCSNTIKGTTVTFSIDPCIGLDKKRIAGQCMSGVREWVHTSANADGTYTCYFKYVFPDGTSTDTSSIINNTPCTYDETA